MSVPSTSDMVPISFFTQQSVEDHGLEKALTLLYNRYKDRLTSLPKEKGWFTETLYLYQGFWLESERVTSAVTVMASQDGFQAQPTDIYLATLQKSGTTWIKALAFAIVNRTTYKTNSLSTHPLQIMNPHRCVPFVETEALFPTYVNGHSPRLFSTHMPYTSLPQSILDSRCRVVYTCRNPKDVLVSLFHYANRLRDKSLGLMTFKEAFEMFRKGLIPFGPYWDHVKGYYMAALERPSEILFLTYEDMQKDTVNNVKRLAEFLGYPFTEEEAAEGEVHKIVKLCSFETLKEVNKHGMVGAGFPNDVFFRNGKIGDWTNHLTNEMSQILDQLTKEKFDGLDISF
ncbi:hypothetical protein L2E82_01012 [Cichorium intybus]|uniref:Uncharacterized protein n=1 Tax=Cichorium intybus TaxID=13427 RepID=A0ACB9GY45_CICIN|nr:hypothetical protein L2E82_01012 [Cichorium intybus]